MGAILCLATLVVGMPGEAAPAPDAGADNARRINDCGAHCL